MLLAAELSRSTLGDILGQLHRARASGVLVLEETFGARAGASHAVHLIGGTPRAVATEGPRLGELLARHGDLEQDRVWEAVRRKRRGDHRLMGEVLRELGSSEAAVTRTLEEQTRARLELLYGLTQARVRFHAALFDDVAPKAWVRAARTARGLSPSDFLHGRPRTRRRVPSPEDERREALRALGLPVGADATTIREAFKRRVHEIHPDRATTDEERVSRTRELARLLSLYQRITG